jgi:hypothetical protein
MGDRRRGRMWNRRGHIDGTLVVNSTSLWRPVAWRFDSVLDALSPSLSAHEPGLAETLRGARAEDGSGLLDMSAWSASTMMVVITAVLRLRQAELAATRQVGQLDRLITALRRDPRVAPTPTDELLVADIIAERDCGVVHCGLSRAGASLSELAVEFGLSPDANYHEIDAASARRLAELVLQREWAGRGVEIMPAARAADLVDQFLAHFKADRVKFFTNGTFLEGAPAATYSPATEATLDTGILVVGPLRSGCLWVEDED